MMRVAVGSDHAGFPLKEDLVAFLAEQGHEVLDLGTDSTEPVDYPAFCAAVARAVADGRADRGIVMGGSGQGEQMTANKIQGIRAAFETAAGMGARIVAPTYAREIVRVWLETPFEGGRHVRRLEQIAEIERGERER